MEIYITRVKSFCGSNGAAQIFVSNLESIINAGRISISSIIQNCAVGNALIPDILSHMLALLRVSEANAEAVVILSSLCSRSGRSDLQQAIQRGYVCYSDTRNASYRTYQSIHAFIHQSVVSVNGFFSIVLVIFSQ